MRKILALLLAVLMVVPAFAFTTSAEQVATQTFERKFVPVFTEDMMPSNDLTSDELLAWRPANLPDNWLWEGVPTVLTYNSTEKGIAATFTGVPSAAGIRFKYSKGLTDITGMTTICFDMYISDVNDANVTGAGWKFQLYNTDSRIDANAKTIHNTTLAALFNGTLVNGWNHFEIPLSMFNTGTTTFDYTQFSGFRLYNRDANVGVEGKTTTLMMKNVYFTNDTITPVTTTGTALSVADVQKNAGETVATGGVDFTTKKHSAVDVSAMDTLSFDLYVSDIEQVNADTGNWKFELWHSDNTYKNGVYLNASLISLNGGALVKGWNRIEIPLAKFSFGSTSTFDWTNVTGFRVYNNHAFTATNDAGDADNTVTFKLKNWQFCYTANEGVVTALAQDGSALTVADVQKNAGETVAKGGVDFATTKHNAVDVSAMDTLSFDLYVSDIEQVNGDTGNWKFELWHSNNAYKNGVYLNESLISLNGGALVKGWNRIEIPLAKFSFGSTSTFDWTNVTGFRVFNNHEFTATDDTEDADTTVTFKIKDWKFVKTVDVHGKNVSVSCEPHLENDVNLIFKVDADYRLTYQPYVQVVFDGHAATMSLDANASFELTNILAHRMSDEIAINLITLNEDGDVERVTYSYSVKAYAASKLGGEQNDALKTLVSDLLHYGAAAQAAINYKMDAVANVDVANIVAARALDTETLAQSMIANPVSGEYTGGAKWKSAKLVLDSAMCIRYVFEAESIEALTVKVNGTEYAIEKDTNAENRYYVDVPVNAGQFDEKFVAQFGDNADYTVTYSVNAYIARNYAKYADVEADKVYNTTATYGEMYNLLTAIYNYGVSAAAYNAQ